MPLEGISYRDLQLGNSRTWFPLYNHQASIFGATNKSRSYYIIHPDWLSESIRPVSKRTRREMLLHHSPQATQTSYQIQVPTKSSEMAWPPQSRRAPSRPTLVSYALPTRSPTPSRPLIPKDLMMTRFSNREIEGLRRYSKCY